MIIRSALRAIVATAIPSSKSNCLGFLAICYLSKHYPKAYFEFEGWGKFLGTERIANQNRKFWSYDNTKDFLSSTTIGSMRYFHELCKTGMIPDEIPKDPKVYYGKEGK